MDMPSPKGRRRWSLDLPGRPRWCVTDATGARAFLAIRDPSMVLVARLPQLDQVQHWALPSGGAHGIDIDHAAGLLYVACDDGALVALDARAGAIRSFSRVPAERALAHLAGEGATDNDLRLIPHDGPAGEKAFAMIRIRHGKTKNAKRTLAALLAFGAPLHDLTEDDLTTPGVTFQIGVPPLRIDILTAISGVEFNEAWPSRLQTRFADQPVGVLSREHLLKNKRAAGRKQDLADVEWLENQTG